MAQQTEQEQLMWAYKNEAYIAKNALRQIRRTIEEPMTEGEKLIKVDEILRYVGINSTIPQDEMGQ